MTKLERTTHTEGSTKQERQNSCKLHARAIDGGVGVAVRVKARYCNDK